MSPAYNCTCVICSSAFVAGRAGAKYCSSECRKRYRRVQFNSSESQYARVSGNWRAYFTRLRHGGERGGKHNRKALAVDDLLDLLKKQGGKCALSGVELTCELRRGYNHLTNASLDRKQAGGPYTKENVQLVCAALNSWRRDTPLSQFIWFCRRVVEKADG